MPAASVAREPRTGSGHAVSQGENLMPCEANSAARLGSCRPKSECHPASRPSTLLGHCGGLHHRTSARGCGSLCRLATLGRTCHRSHAHQLGPKGSRLTITFPRPFRTSKAGEEVSAPAIVGGTSAVSSPVRQSRPRLHAPVSPGQRADVGCSRHERVTLGDDQLAPARR